MSFKRKAQDTPRVKSKQARREHDKESTIKAADQAGTSPAVKNETRKKDQSHAKSANGGKALINDRRKFDSDTTSRKHAEVSNDSKTDETTRNPLPTVSSSLLKDEGKAFPRGDGGGSSLTPVERKQMQIRVTRDALLESSKPKGSKQSRKDLTDSSETAGQPNKPRRKKAEAPNPNSAASREPQRDPPAEPLGLGDLSTGMITVGRVTKVEDYAVFVQLGTELAGRIGLTELEDNFDHVNPHQHKKHEKLRVCVLEVDVPNKKTVLTTRPSKVLSSSLPVKDPIVPRISSLQQDQIVRGFVKNVAEIGLFVILSHSVTAFVRVPELSDDFVADWRSQFQIDQLVTGRIVALDESARRVQMSLKASVIAEGYKRPMSFTDLHEGDIVKGKIRKVETYGAFIVVDNSENVSGLCHRSEMAEARVENVHALYSEGDRVKAKVLSLDPEKRKVSFGLKAAYFIKHSEGSGLDDMDDPTSSEDEGKDVVGGVKMSGSMDVLRLPLEDEDSDKEDDQSSSEVDDNEGACSRTTENHQIEGLDGGSFDWNPDVSKQINESSTVESTAAEEGTKKKTSRKPKILEDHTDDLDRYGPRSTGDYERLLLGQRDDAQLWIRYMAFHLNRQDSDASRAVAERALREIGITRQAEKLDVWTAWLNLELKVGTEDSVEDVFKRACEVTDRYEMHDRMATCYIDAGWFKKADEIFTAMTKHRDWTVGPDFWTSYAKFLFNKLDDQARARDLLQRAMQSVYSHRHPQLLLSFAKLEFKCTGGDSERGRTMFEGLIDTYPKHWDYWDIYIATENARQEWDNVRGLYERMTSKNAPGMKQYRAKKVFKAWKEFEEGLKEHKCAKRVEARQRDYEERFVAKE